MKKLLPFLIIFILIFSGCSLSKPGQKADLPKASNDTELSLSQKQQNQIDLNNKTNNNLNLAETETISSKETTMSDYSQIQTATINTNKGEIKIKLYQTDAPNTIKNFLSKAENEFYNNLIFHRVEDWVIQGGDPDGNGTGGGKMPTELNQVEFKIGSVGIARGNDINWSNDAQFFICKTDCNFLTGQYTNFGEVTNGMEVVNKIEIGDQILGINFE